jgi:hypothetical protein
VALAGCGVVQFAKPLEPAPWVQADRPQPGSDAESLLLYFQYLRRLSGPEAVREHEAARQAYASARTDFNRVRLAMALSLPGMPFTDDARALGLLDTVARHQDSQLQGLAVVLGTYLQEQLRIAASAQGLQEKLDALRSLERTMIERAR